MTKLKIRKLSHTTPTSNFQKLFVIKLNRQIIVNTDTQLIIVIITLFRLHYLQELCRKHYAAYALVKASKQI